MSSQSRSTGVREGAGWVREVTAAQESGGIGRPVRATAAVDVVRRVGRCPPERPGPGLKVARVESVPIAEEVAEPRAIGTGWDRASTVAMAANRATEKCFYDTPPHTCQRRFQNRSRAFSPRFFYFAGPTCLCGSCCKFKYITFFVFQFDRL